MSTGKVRRKYTECDRGSATPAGASTPLGERETAREPELSARQRAAINSLTEEGTISAAALRVGITASTLRRWLKQPEFQAALEEASDPEKMLKRAALSALRTLIKAQKDPSPAIRVRAAIAILNLARDADEYEKFEEKLSLLEGILKTKG